MRNIASIAGLVLILALAAACQGNEPVGGGTNVEGTSDYRTNPSTSNRITPIPAHRSDEPTINSLTPRTAPFGIIPDWPKHYTDSPAAKTVRWYEGAECPSGSYNIFDRTYHISRDGHEGEADAFAHSDSYICMAEKFNLNIPSYTHLHELAHSILLHAGDLTHGHTDRYGTLVGNLTQIHRVKTTISEHGERYCPPEQITQTETIHCREIHRLQNELQSLLQVQASLYPGGVVASNRPDPTPTPTPPPPTPTPTPLPLSTHADPENGFSIKFPSQWDTRSQWDEIQFPGGNIRVQNFLAYPRDRKKDLLLVIAIPVSKSEYLTEKKAILLDPPGDWTSYDTTPTTGSNPNSAKYWQVDYTRSYPKISCLREGLLRIYESTNADDQPITVHVEMVACQKRFRDLLTTRSKIFDSFTRTRIPIVIDLSAMPTPVHLTVTAELLPLGTTSRLPTSTPVLAPTPTPTPIPPNIHASTMEQYAYNIEFPRGWTPKQEQDGHAVFTSPDGTSGAEISIRRLGSEGSTASLADERNQELLARMRATPRESQSLFEMKPHQPPPTTVTDQLSQAWQMEYRWRESSEQCLRDVVDVVSPSNRFTHSILISAWVCEDSLDKEAETERQEILGSFRGKTTG